MDKTKELLKRIGKIDLLKVPGLMLTEEQIAALREYDEVQNLPWQQAAANCREAISMAAYIGPTGYFAIMQCKNALDRYNKGERSRELFELMKEKG